jgi:hypothetical protein
MRECVVKITTDAYPNWVAWLVQTNDDRRVIVGEREEATVFATPDAATSAAETFLVESCGDSPEMCKYEILRW